MFPFVHRAIVQCEEKLTISASWAKDEDISRLLQSLPNWANMAQPRQTRQKREDEEDFTRYTRQDALPAYAPAYINCLRAFTMTPDRSLCSNKHGNKCSRALCKHKQASSKEDGDSHLSGRAANPSSRRRSFIRMLLNPVLLLRRTSFKHALTSCTEKTREEQNK